VRYAKGSIDGGRAMACTREGAICIITPMNDRNQDSIVASLKSADVERANVPEFVLFVESNANASTVFQKNMKVVEKLTLSKWGAVLLPAD
jgi:hypothetical protein